MLASQVKGVADVIMISETKLEDTFPEDQFVVEGFSKHFRIDCNKNEGGILLLAREDIPARLISIEKTPIESFILLSLTCARKIGLYIVLAIPTKTTYPHIWKS